MENGNSKMEALGPSRVSDQERLLRQSISAAISAAGGIKKMVYSTGIPRGTLEKYVAETSTPSFLNAAKIASYLGVTLDDLAGTDRSKFGGSSDGDQQDSGLTDLNQSGMVAIPRYDEVRPSAGPGSAATSETPTTRVAFERHWLTEIGVQADTAVILPAQGDSMEPTIMNGSPMLVDTSKTEVQNGYIYVIAVENDLLVKRVRRRLDGRIDLISDNRAYDPETLDAASLQQLRVIGRVYASVSKF